MGAHAVYGVDQGLRDADKDKRFLSFAEQHPSLHETLLAAKWCLRDWMGFDSKRHSNTELVNVVFVDWLRLNAKLVERVHKQAEQRVKTAAKQLAQKQAVLKKTLQEQGVRVVALAGEP